MSWKFKSPERFREVTKELYEKGRVEVKKEDIDVVGPFKNLSKAQKLVYDKIAEKGSILIEDLAKQLGISMVALEKRIHRIRKKGYKIFSSRRKMGGKGTYSIKPLMRPSEEPVYEAVKRLGNPTVLEIHSELPHLALTTIYVYLGRLRKKDYIKVDWRPKEYARYSIINKK